MSDRLEEIKHRIKITCIAGKYADGLSVEDKYWLISELEESRAEAKELVKNLEEAEDNVLELQRIALDG